MDQYLLSSCCEAESALEKSVQQTDNKCKGPGAGYAEVLPEQAPTALWLEQGEQADNRGDEVRQEVFGD